MKNKCHIRQKTLWGKEKLLITSNFSFSHNVFYSCISLVRQNVALCGNGLKIRVENEVKDIFRKGFWMNRVPVREKGIKIGHFNGNWESGQTKINHFLITLTIYQTTDFRLFLIQSVCRGQFQVLWKWQTVLQKGWKHCWKRWNSLLGAISLFPQCFKKLVLQKGKNKGKELNLCQKTKV